MTFEEPRFETGPGKEKSSLEYWIRKGVQEARAQIEEKYEGREDEAENLPFHNTDHTQRVTERIYIILTAMKGGGETIEAKDFQLGRLAAASHDIIQNWEPNEKRDGRFKKITRFRPPQNEAASANWASEFMSRANRETKSQIFSADDQARVGEAITATVPSFESKLKTVIQPNLTKNSPPLARALALADLGAAGMDGYPQLKKDGDAVFREDNLDILKAMQKPAKITPKKEHYFRERMFEWSDPQIDFAEGRKAMLEQELAGLTDAAKEKVKALFSRFDESIDGARATRRRREKMSFKELARDMGYSL